MTRHRIVNDYLIRHCDLSPATSDIIGLVVSQRITFRKAIGYPEPLLVGLSVSKVGRSSVTYRVGLFEATRRSERTEKGVLWQLERKEEVRLTAISLNALTLSSPARTGSGCVD